MHLSKFTGTIAVATLFAIVLPAHQARAGTFDLDVTTTAIHTRAWAQRDLNQVNPGLGLEYHFTRTWGVMGGVYRNSYKRPTWYTAATFTPLHLGRTNGWQADAGIGAGLATGYTRRENSVAPAMAAGVLRVRTPSGTGVNLLWVPNQPHDGTGFVGLQISIPLR